MKILIIEDDAFLKNLVSEKFSREGFEVLVAGSSAETDKVLAEVTPEIILLDLVLPQVDGFEILERIKKDEKTKNIPVVVFSNLSDPKDIERAKNLGAAHFIVKANFTLDEIVQKIKGYLNPAPSQPQA